MVSTAITKEEPPPSPPPQAPKEGSADPGPEENVPEPAALNEVINEENNNNAAGETIATHNSIDEDIADLNFDLPADNADTTRFKEIIASSHPTTELEIALKAELDRILKHNEVLITECAKLRGFVSKRKHSYKRKRKDENAPRKKLSGYNLFVRERFAKLAKENEDALKSADSGAELKRIPPAKNIVGSGHAWSRLSKEEKARYNELAKADVDRFERETANYQPSDRTRKRAKTGYNMFFSEYVRARVRQEGEMPLERGSTARVVGDAWKKMSVDEKEIYERQADEINEKDPPHAMDGFIRMPPPKPKQQPAPQQPVPPHPQFVNEEAPQMEPPPAPMQYEGPPMPDPNEMPPPPPPMPPPYGPPPPDYGMPGPPVIHAPPPGGEYEYYGPPPPGAPPPPHFDPYAYPPPYPLPGMGGPMGGMPGGLPPPMPPNYQPHPDAPPPYYPPPPEYAMPPGHF